MGELVSPRAVKVVQPTRDSLQNLTQSSISDHERFQVLNGLVGLVFLLNMYLSSPKV